MMHGLTNPKLKNSNFVTLFMTRRGKKAGDSRQLHREKLYYFYSSPNEECYCLAEHVACIRKRRNVHRV